MDINSLRWSALSTRARSSLVVLLVLGALALAIALFWMTRPSYGVLFSELGERDLTSMAGELDRMKVPYQVGTDGRSLLVPERQVHKVRLDLMSHEPALQGGVGFEIFSNSDFGMTEFAQKVNYQRALQGELARTIQAAEGVRSARVHLAMPEQSLFRKGGARTTASVTVTLERDRSLSPAQVVGIQRLVSASVPETDAADVTVFDQRGVALSASNRPGEGSAGPAALERKHETETYLADKASRVLDGMLGAGTSLVSVDAVFVDEKRQMTVEEMLPSFSSGGRAPTGVTLRERLTSRGPAADASAAHSDAGSSSSTETDYQIGKRTEQINTPAGAIRRLNVAIVIKSDLDEVRMSRLRGVVAAAVGLDARRGDVLAVSTMNQRSQESQPVPAAPQGAVAAPPLKSPAPPLTGNQSHALGGDALAVLGVIALLASLLAIAFIARRGKDTPAKRLDAAQREDLLRSVQGWLREADVSMEKSA